MKSLIPSLNRRTVLASGLAALAAPAIVRPAHAQAVTLRLHHFLPAVSNVHTKVLQPWADRIAAASNNALKIELFPSMQLGGTPPQLYNQARDGVADIIWTLPGNTPGRFPRTEVFELPFLASQRGSVNARAAQEFADTHLAEETRDVKLLAYWAHDAGVIHANKQIQSLDDLRGLKLRNPTRLAGEALKALGAVSVGMPVPQVPESLAQRVIDGAVIPWEVVPSVRVHELVRFHTEIPGSPALYTASFFLAMNQAKFAGLPAELRAVIDRQSGMAFSSAAGPMWDAEAKTVSDMVRARGNTISVLSAAEKARWVAATESVAPAWIAQMRERNIDGNALIAAAKALVAKYERA